MFVIAFTTLIACMSTLTSADWKLRALNEYSSVISMEQRRFNKEVMIMSLAEDRSLESLTSMDNGASWKTTTIPKQDYTVTSNVSKDRLNFENLPFNFETKEISPFGETGVAVTGRFHYLHSEDMFNGIALKADITSNSWRVFSLSTNTTEADQLLFATHSSFPTKETWYTVLSTVPTEKQKKASTNAFSHFNVKTGEFIEMNHPLSVEKQDALPSNKQFLAVYKTSNSGNDWDKILEVKEDFNSYMQDFQCFDDVTCVALIQRLDQTAVILMTKDGGKTWTKIYENKDTKKELKSIFLQSHENFWVVVEGLSKEGKVQSMLFHTVIAGEAWNDDITIPEVEGLEKIFFYKGGVGATDDDYRYVEGLIIRKTKEGKQMIQQIVAEL